MEAVDPRWRKSSFSGNGGDCVEVGHAARAVAVRDTKDCTGPVLQFTPSAWRKFANRVKRLLGARWRLAGRQAWQSLPVPALSWGFQAPGGVFLF
jgi:hypothetical protein